MGTQQCKRIYTLDKIKLFENLQEDQTVLKIDWNYDSISSQSLTFFTKLKHVKFRKPTFKIDSLVLTNEGYKFLISSTEFCKAVYIEENESSSFFPNFFDLAPGEQLSISCKTQNKSIDLKDLEIISLYDHLEK